MQYQGVESMVDAKLKYYNHLKRINNIAFKNTNTTKDIVKHQVQLNSYNRFKDLSRQFNYRRKMDGLLDENKKIYGNLARINSQPPRKEVIDGAHAAQEKEYFKKLSERSRVLNLVELERNNLKLAQRIATAYDMLMKKEIY